MNSHASIIPKTWGSDDNGPRLVPPEDAVVFGANTNNASDDEVKQSVTVFPRSELEAILEDKVCGTNTSGSDKLGTFEEIDGTATEIPLCAFTHMVNNVPFALKRFGKFEIAEEDVGNAMEFLVRRIGDWYDAQKMKDAKRSSLKFFSYWVASLYTPTAAMVESKLVEADFTASKVKELVKEYQASQLESKQHVSHSAEVDKNTAVAPPSSDITNVSSQRGVLKTIQLSSVVHKEQVDVDALYNEIGTLKADLKVKNQQIHDLKLLLDAPLVLADEQTQHAATRNKLKKALDCHQHTGKCNFYAPPLGPTKEEREAAAAQASTAAKKAQLADRSAPLETRMAFADMALEAETKSHEVTKRKLKAVNESISNIFLEES